MCHGRDGATKAIDAKSRLFSRFNWLSFLPLLPTCGQPEDKKRTQGTGGEKQRSNFV